MLANARHNFDAWWLTLFPGLAIFACVVSCNVIGDALSARKN
jgi:ABC-type dipeptide/oligopeptide/nickel transport system permease subunit